MTVESNRLLFLLEIAATEGRHLLGTRARLFAESIDASWVQQLENRPEVAERLDAFVIRFGRMQDTVGDKLIPQLLRCFLETPGAALDNLNRMEKLGLLTSVVDWVEARALRNRLVHEYVRDAAEFAEAVNRAGELIALLVRTYNALNESARARFGQASRRWPGSADPVTPRYATPFLAPSRCGWPIA